MAHSNWPEWIYVGVVIALMCWVGAEAWEAERLVEHTPADAEIIKVTDTMEIAKHGVFGTPAVFVDGEVKSVGKIPSKDEIISWIKK